MNNNTDVILTPEQLDSVKFYAVRNREGKWFRAKGFGGGGNTWVDNLEKAKLYGKIGPARAQVTYFSKHYPKYGVPYIIQFSFNHSFVVIDETQRVEKAIAEQKQNKIKAELFYKKERIKSLQEQMDKLKKSLDNEELKNKS